jgi:hypothetical protein
MVGFEYSTEEGHASLLAFPGGSRAEVGAVRLTVGAEPRSGTGLEAVAQLAIRSFRLILSLSEADSFVRDVSPEDEIVVNADVLVRWSQLHGLHFQGSGGLVLPLAVHLEIGPITIQALELSIGASTAGIDLGLGVAFDLDIGPVHATVNGLGVEAALALEEGNLGPVDLDLGFKPPTGLGLGIEAGPVTGAGFIDFDPDEGRYSGIFQLEILTVVVTVVGLLDTRLPDGRDGYSFLIIISAEFTPIQLGFGFTLNGVGGLAGIHRSLNAEALRTGVYTGSLDSILFQTPPIRNPAQLVSDLSRVFPVAEGQFTFGPMAKIGWGVPTLITIDLGIIIELPSPVRIALLGRIGAALPEAEGAIIEIHVDFIAIVDFAAKLFSLDATLRDSRILVWTLTGDMAMRLSWGDRPNFAVALGGFHPAFPVPTGFPTLRRLALAMGAGDSIRLTCQSYQALTSNSLQFGARMELYVDVGVYVHGWIGFDALFVFSPFSFQVDFCAGLEVGVDDVQLAGVTVDGTLSGPTPWRVRGSATISLLFFDITARFDEKFGSEEQAVVVAEDPWRKLREALVDQRNWAATLPAGALNVVSVQTPPGGEAAFVDPVGRVTWRERVVPLDRTLAKFGSVALEAPVRFTVDQVRVGGASAAFARVDDYFSPGQVEELTDDQKLSRASFERMQAGIEVASASVHHGPPVIKDIEYETRLIDSATQSRPGSLLALAARIHLALGAATQSSLVTAGFRAFSAPLSFREADEGFVVASTVDLTLRPDITGPTTQGAAWQALDAHLAEHPEERGTLQIVPSHELEAA